jgi:hypothetical protein
MDPEVQEPQHNVSYEGMIEDQTSETKSVAPGIDQHIEEPITTFIESLESYENHPFTDPLSLPLIDPPSMRYINAYSSYNLPPGSTTTQSVGMNPPIFGFPEGLGNLSLSTTPVVDTFGASSLLGTSMTQVTSTQPLENTFPFTHGLGNIHASLFPHMHMPSASLGQLIGQMANSQFVHTTTVTQVTQPPSQTLQMSTPYIGGQSSMEGQPLAGGKPSTGGKNFTGGKPMWLQHKKSWGQAAPASPSIHTTTGLYPGQPYPRFSNPFWGQSNPAGIPQQGTFPYQSINPMILTQQYLQTQYMVGPSGQSPYMGGPSGQSQYVGGPSVQSQYMGGQLGKPPYMGGKSGKPPYMGGQLRQSPYMGGPSSFSISSQPGYGPTGVPMPHGYHQYPHDNRQLPFFAMLYLPDLSHLTNNLIQQALFWPSIPAKLPSDILKFDGKPGEYPNNHVTTFHLWCSPNSLMDDSIHLRLFQRTLTGATTK